MKYLLTFAIITTLFSCRKTEIPKPAPPQPAINYQIVNKTVKASDVNPLTIDVDADGRIDYYFFAQYVANSSGVHLYVGVNPITGNFTKMGNPNDDHFLNMGDAAGILSGRRIDDSMLPAKIWNDEAAYLLIRHQNRDGSINYEGDWNDGNPYFLPLRFIKNGSYVYGWARLSFDKQSEVLELKDLAWNTNAGQEIIAGEY